MSTIKRKIRAGFVTILVLCGSAQAVDAQEVAPGPAPPGLDPSPNRPTFAVLLLTNGNVQQGPVALDKTGEWYELHQKGGVIRLAKAQVDRRFGSIAELYAYKASIVPARDPDERLKLAQWCLLYKLNVEAREQLQALVQINPGDQRALRMIAGLDATVERSVGRDPDVRAAGAEMVEPTATPMPRPSAVRSNAPIVIFDLPPAQASRRATEYAWYIHPILQQNCAGCHNENYPGEFRLYAGKSRREWTPDVLRSNLDATLRFVDRDDPGRSDLLAYAVNAHGPTPNRPIFHGANDKRQRDLATWLASLKPATAASKPTAASNATASAAPSSRPRLSSGAFGSDRTTPIPAPAGNPTGPDLPTIPQGRNFEAEYTFQGAAPGVPPGLTFEPTSPLQGGPPLPLPGPRGVSNRAPKPNPAVPSTPPGAGMLPELPPGTPVPQPDDVIPPTNRDKKAKKVDNALLEKLMKARQPGQP